MNEKENIANMRKCPRFNTCNIPRCPLDYWMSDRTELKEDQKCPLEKIYGKTKSKRRSGILSQQMKDIANFVCKKNKN